MDETKKCQSCGEYMQYAGKVPFRIGGTPGGTKLLFGELAELGECMLPMDVWICPKCGKVKLVVGEKTKRRLVGLPPPKQGAKP
jgi:hypothetical protein